MSIRRLKSIVESVDSHDFPIMSDFQKYADWIHELKKTPWKYYIKINDNLHYIPDGTRFEAMRNTENMYGPFNTIDTSRDKDIIDSRYGGLYFLDINHDYNIMIYRIPGNALTIYAKNEGDLEKIVYETHLDKYGIDVQNVSELTESVINESIEYHDHDFPLRSDFDSKEEWAHEVTKSPWKYYLVMPGHRIHGMSGILGPGQAELIDTYIGEKNREIVAQYTYFRQDKNIIYYKFDKFDSNSRMDSYAAIFSTSKEELEEIFHRLERGGYTSPISPIANLMYESVDDFPHVDDFDNEEDWWHEISKSNFKYVMRIPHYANRDLSATFTRNDLSLSNWTDIGPKNSRYSLRINDEGTIIWLFTVEKGAKLFAKDRETLEDLRKTLKISDKHAVKDLTSLYKRKLPSITSGHRIHESIEYDHDFPIRSDFDSDKDWNHEIKKTDFKYYIVFSQTTYFEGIKGVLSDNEWVMVDNGRTKNGNALRTHLTKVSNDGNMVLHISHSIVLYAKDRRHIEEVLDEYDRKTEQKNYWRDYIRPTTELISESVEYHDNSFPLRGDFDSYSEWIHEIKKSPWKYVLYVYDDTYDGDMGFHFNMTYILDGQYERFENIDMEPSGRRKNIHWSPDDPEEDIREPGETLIDDKGEVIVHEHRELNYVMVFTKSIDVHRFVYESFEKRIKDGLEHRISGGMVTDIKESMNESADMDIFPHRSDFESYDDWLHEVKKSQFKYYVEVIDGGFSVDSFDGTYTSLDDGRYVYSKDKNAFYATDIREDSAVVIHEESHGESYLLLVFATTKDILLSVMQEIVAQEDQYNVGAKFSKIHTTSTTGISESVITDEFPQRQDFDSHEDWLHEVKKTSYKFCIIIPPVNRRYPLINAANALYRDSAYSIEIESIFDRETFTATNYYTTSYNYDDLILHENDKRAFIAFAKTRKQLELLLDAAINYKSWNDQNYDFEKYYAIKSTSQLSESVTITESTDHDFPLRSDFDSYSDWIHEVKKTNYKYVINASNLNDTELRNYISNSSGEWRMIDKASKRKEAPDTTVRSITKARNDGNIIQHWESQIIKTHADVATWLFAKEEKYLREIPLKRFKHKDIIMMTSRMVESLNESYDILDFPLRSDFETDEDWIHELKKSPYQFTVKIPDHLIDRYNGAASRPGRNNNYAWRRIDAHEYERTESEKKMSHEWEKETHDTYASADGSIIRCYRDYNGYIKYATLYSRTREDMANFFENIDSDMARFIDIKMTSELQEDTKYEYVKTDDNDYVFPLRSDFRSYKDWMHEVKKTPYEYMSVNDVRGLGVGGETGWSMIETGQYKDDSDSGVAIPYGIAVSPDNSLVVYQTLGKTHDLIFSKTEEGLREFLNKKKLPLRIRKTEDHMWESDARLPRKYSTKKYLREVENIVKPFLNEDTTEYNDDFPLLSDFDFNSSEWMHEVKKSPFKFMMEPNSYIAHEIDSFLSYTEEDWPEIDKGKRLGYSWSIRLCPNMNNNVVLFKGLGRSGESKYKHDMLIFSTTKEELERFVKRVISYGIEMGDTSYSSEHPWSNWPNFDKEIKSVETMKESVIYEGYDDFPLRSDFRNNEDWIHELKKSEYQHVMFVYPEDYTLLLDLASQYDWERIEHEWHPGTEPRYYAETSPDQSVVLFEYSDLYKSWRLLFAKKIEDLEKIRLDIFGGDAPIKHVSELTESVITESFDDFPIRSDFDNTEDWLHEITKSAYKYSATLHKHHSSYLISQVNNEGDNWTVIDPENPDRASVNQDGSIVVAKHNPHWDKYDLHGHIVIYAKTKKDLYIFLDDMHMTAPMVTIKSTLSESADNPTPEDFPIRADFEKYSDWLHEVKKSPYQFVLEYSDEHIYENEIENIMACSLAEQGGHDWILPDHYASPNEETLVHPKMDLITHMGGPGHLRNTVLVFSRTREEMEDFLDQAYELYKEIDGKEPTEDHKERIKNTTVLKEAAEFINDDFPLRSDFEWEWDWVHEVKKSSYKYYATLYAYDIRKAILDKVFSKGVEYLDKEQRNTSDGFVYDYYIISTTDRKYVTYYKGSNDKSLVFAKSKEDLNELFQNTAYMDWETYIKPSASLKESIENQNHDFPLRSDFDSHSDWIHEVKKSPFKFFMFVYHDDIDAIYHTLQYYHPDGTDEYTEIDSAPKNRWFQTEMRGDGKVVIHDERANLMKIFSTSKEELKKIKEVFKIDEIDTRIYATEKLSEAVVNYEPVEYTFPVRSDFDSDSDWFHEIKKTDYKYMVMTSHSSTWDVLEMIRELDWYTIEIKRGPNEDTTSTLISEDRDVVYCYAPSGTVFLFSRDKEKLENLRTLYAPGPLVQTSDLIESIEHTSYDDFPLRGDFDSYSEWIHEVKKSPWKYMTRVTHMPIDKSIWDEIESIRVSSALLKTYYSDSFYLILQNTPGGFIATIFGRTEESIKNYVWRADPTGTSHYIIVTRTEDLKESNLIESVDHVVDDFPRLSDFDGYSDWIHELKKSPYEFVLTMHNMSLTDIGYTIYAENYPNIERVIIDSNYDRTESGTYSTYMYEGYPIIYHNIGIRSPTTHAYAKSREDLEEIRKKLVDSHYRFGHSSIRHTSELFESLEHSLEESAEYYTDDFPLRSDFDDRSDWYHELKKSPYKFCAIIDSIDSDILTPGENPFENILKIDKSTESNKHYSTFLIKDKEIIYHTAGYPGHILIFAKSEEDMNQLQFPKNSKRGKTSQLKESVNINEGTVSEDDFPQRSDFDSYSDWIHEVKKSPFNHAAIIQQEKIFHVRSIVSDIIKHYQENSEVEWVNLDRNQGDGHISFFNKKREYVLYVENIGIFFASNDLGLANLKRMEKTFGLRIMRTEDLPEHDTIPKKEVSESMEYQDHGFPLRGDFDNYDDWIHEVKKSPFKYSLSFSGPLRVENFYDIFYRIDPDDFVDLENFDEEGCYYNTRINRDKTIVTHENIAGHPLYMLTKNIDDFNRIKDLARKRRIEVDTSHFSEGLNESIDDFPHRTDFETDEEWFHEVAKSPFKYAMVINYPLGTSDEHAAITRYINNNETWTTIDRLRLGLIVMNADHTVVYCYVSSREKMKSIIYSKDKDYLLNLQKLAPSSTVYDTSDLEYSMTLNESNHLEYIDTDFPMVSDFDSLTDWAHEVKKTSYEFFVAMSSADAWNILERVHEEDWEEIEEDNKIGVMTLVNDDQSMIFCYTMTKGSLLLSRNKDDLDRILQEVYGRNFEIKNTAELKESAIKNTSSLLESKLNENAHGHNFPVPSDFETQQEWHHELKKSPYQFYVTIHCFDIQNGQDMLHDIIWEKYPYTQIDEEYYGDSDGTTTWIRNDTPTVVHEETRSDKDNYTVTVFSTSIEDINEITTDLDNLDDEEEDIIYDTPRSVSDLYESIQINENQVHDDFPSNNDFDRPVDWWHEVKKSPYKFIIDLDADTQEEDTFMKIMLDSGINVSEVDSGRNTYTKTEGDCYIYSSDDGNLIIYYEHIGPTTLLFVFSKSKEFLENLAEKTTEDMNQRYISRSIIVQSVQDIRPWWGRNVSLGESTNIGDSFPIRSDFSADHGRWVHEVKKTDYKYTAHIPYVNTNDFTKIDDDRLYPEGTKGLSFSFQNARFETYYTGFNDIILCVVAGLATYLYAKTEEDIHAFLEKYEVEADNVIISDILNLRESIEHNSLPTLREIGSYSDWLKEIKEAGFEYSMKFSKPLTYRFKKSLELVRKWRIIDQGIGYETLLKYDGSLLMHFIYDHSFHVFAKTEKDMNDIRYMIDLRSYDVDESADNIFESLEYHEDNFPHRSDFESAEDWFHEIKKTPFKHAILVPSYLVIEMTVMIEEMVNANEWSLTDKYRDQNDSMYTTWIKNDGSLAAVKCFLYSSRLSHSRDLILFSKTEEDLKTILEDGGALIGTFEQIEPTLSLSMTFEESKMVESMDYNDHGFPLHNDFDSSSEWIHEVKKSDFKYIGSASSEIYRYVMQNWNIIDEAPEKQKPMPGFVSSRERPGNTFINDDRDIVCYYNRLYAKDKEKLRNFIEETIAYYYPVSVPYSREPDAIIKSIDHIKESTGSHRLRKLNNLLESIHPDVDMLTESVDHHNFPIRSDFDSNRDWVHEVKKSPYRYFISVFGMDMQEHVHDVLRTNFSQTIDKFTLVDTRSPVNYNAYLFFSEDKDVVILFNNGTNTFYLFGKSEEDIKSIFHKTRYDNEYAYDIRPIENFTTTSKDELATLAHPIRESVDASIVHNFPIRRDFEKWEDWIHELKKTDYKYYLPIPSDVARDHIAGVWNTIEEHPSDWELYGSYITDDQMMACYNGTIVFSKEKDPLIDFARGARIYAPVPKKVEDMRESRDLNESNIDYFPHRSDFDSVEDWVYEVKKYGFRYAINTYPTAVSLYVIDYFAKRGRELSKFDEGTYYSLYTNEDADVIMYRSPTAVLVLAKNREDLDDLREQELSGMPRDNTLNIEDLDPSAVHESIEYNDHYFPIRSDFDSKEDWEHEVKKSPFKHSIRIGDSNKAHNDIWKWEDLDKGYINSYGDKIGTYILKINKRKNVVVSLETLHPGLTDSPGYKRTFSFYAIRRKDIAKYEAEKKGFIESTELDKHESDNFPLRSDFDSCSDWLHEVKKTAYKFSLFIKTKSLPSLSIIHNKIANNMVTVDYNKNSDGTFYNTKMPQLSNNNVTNLEVIIHVESYINKFSYTKECDVYIFFKKEKQKNMIHKKLMSVGDVVSKMTSELKESIDYLNFPHKSDFSSHDDWIHEVKKTPYKYHMLLPLQVVYNYIEHNGEWTKVDEGSIQGTYMDSYHIFVKDDQSMVCYVPRNEGAILLFAKDEKVLQVFKIFTKQLPHNPIKKTEDIKEYVWESNITESYDDFPYRSDFDSWEEWSHEIKKSDYKHFMIAPKFAYSAVDRNDDWKLVDTDISVDTFVTRYYMYMYKDGGMVWASEGGSNLMFAKNKEDLEAFKDKYLIPETRNIIYPIHRLDNSFKESRGTRRLNRLIESIYPDIDVIEESYDDFPHRSDFGWSYSGWLHEVGKSSYRYTASVPRIYFPNIYRIINPVPYGEEEGEWENIDSHDDSKEITFYRNDGEAIAHYNRANSEYPIRLFTTSEQTIRDILHQIGDKKPEITRMNSYSPKIRENINESRDDIPLRSDFDSYEDWLHEVKKSPYQFTINIEKRDAYANFLATVQKCHDMGKEVREIDRETKNKSIVHPKQAHNRILASDDGSIMVHYDFQKRLQIFTKTEEDIKQIKELLSQDIWFVTTDKTVNLKESVEHDDFPLRSDFDSYSDWLHEVKKTAYKFVLGPKFGSIEQNVISQVIASSTMFDTTNDLNSPFRFTTSSANNGTIVIHYETNLDTRETYVFIFSKDKKYLQRLIQKAKRHKTDFPVEIKTEIKRTDRLRESVNHRDDFPHRSDFDSYSDWIHEVKRSPYKYHMTAIYDSSVYDNMNLAASPVDVLETGERFMTGIGRNNGMIFHLESKQSMPPRRIIILSTNEEDLHDLVRGTKLYLEVQLKDDEMSDYVSEIKPTEQIDLRILGEASDVLLDYDDFPIRSEFPTYSDWLHEVKKSSYKFVISFDDSYYHTKNFFRELWTLTNSQYNILDTWTRDGNEDPEGIFKSRISMDREMVVHTEETDDTTLWFIFFNSEDKFNKAKEIIKREGHHDSGYTATTTSSLTESSNSVDNFPLRSDFDDRSDWMNEIKKSVYKFTAYYLPENIKQEMYQNIHDDLTGDMWDKIDEYEDEVHLTMTFSHIPTNGGIIIHLEYKKTGRHGVDFYIMSSSKDDLAELLNSLADIDNDSSYKGGTNSMIISTSNLLESNEINEDHRLDDFPLRSDFETRSDWMHEVKKSPYRYTAICHPQVIWITDNGGWSPIEENTGENVQLRYMTYMKDDGDMALHYEATKDEFQRELYFGYLFAKEEGYIEKTIEENEFARNAVIISTQTSLLQESLLTEEYDQFDFPLRGDFNSDSDWLHEVKKSNLKYCHLVRPDKRTSTEGYIFSLMQSRTWGNGNPDDKYKWERIEEFPEHRRKIHRPGSTDNPGYATYMNTALYVVYYTSENISLFLAADPKAIKDVAFGTSIDIINLDELKEGQMKEARDASLSYTEKKVKGQIDRVIVELEGHESGKFTRITNRFRRLKFLKEAIAEREKGMNEEIKDAMTKYFDATDEIYTRVIDTISLTMTLAKNPASVEKFDAKGYTEHLEDLLEKMGNDVDAIRKQYTSVVPNTKSPALRTALKDSLIYEDNIIEKLKSLSDKVYNWVNKRLSYYDKKNKLLRDMVMSVMLVTSATTISAGDQYARVRARGAGQAATYMKDKIV